MSQTTSGRNSLLESSFDESTESLDLNSVIAEFPNGDDHPSVIPIKKLSAVFESCVQSDVNVKVIENVLCSGNDGMKVYLRVRPVSDSSINTITVESETTISTVAPDTSKRAQYTKMEERHYVSSHTYFLYFLYSYTYQYSFTTSHLHEFLTVIQNKQMYFKRQQHHYLPDFLKAIVVLCLHTV